MKSTANHRGLSKLNVSPNDSGKKETELFEIKVALNYNKGMTKKKAVETAMKEHPDLYLEYVKRLKSGGRDHTDGLLGVIDRQFENEYRQSPELQEEFKTVETYVAYRRGVMEDRVRVIWKRKHG